MNKVLFNFLVVGVSFVGLQNASAVKSGKTVINMVEQEGDVYRTPKKEKKKMIPHGPMKPKLRSFGEAKVVKFPEKNEMRGNARWTEAPPRPVSSYTSTSRKGYR